MKSCISLRTYLSAQFGIIALLPILAVTFILWFFIMPEEREQTRIRHQALARTVAGQMSTLLEDGEQQLKALAEYIQYRQKFAGSQLTPLLDAHCGNSRFFEAIFITGTQKAVIQTMGLTPLRRPHRLDFIGLDLSGRKFIHRPATSDKPFWSETFLSTVSSQMAVALTVPLNDGFIIGEITLKRLANFIRSLQVQSGFVIMVLDSRRQVIADSRSLYSGRVFDAQTAQNTSGRFELDNVKMLGALVDIDTAGWKVLVAQPVHMAFQTIRDTFKLGGIAIAVILGLIFVMSWLLAGRLSSLFRHYTRAAEAIARGDYTVNLRRVRSKELSLLNRTLTVMAEKIRQRESSLHLTQFCFDHAQIGIYHVGIQGEIKNANAYAGKMLGYSPSELSQLSISDIDPVISPQTMAKIWRKVKNHGHKIFETTLKRKDGSLIPVEIFGNHLQYEGDQFLISFVQDITRRKQLETALKESQERLEMALEGANEGIWDLSLNDEIVYLDSRYYTLAGYEPGEFPATLNALWDRIHKDDLERVQTAFEQYIKSHHGIYETQFRFLRKDGTYMWILSKGKVVAWDAHGNPTRIIGTNTDITALKQAEEALNERMSGCFMTFWNP